MPRLVLLPPDAYASQVLPLTQELWAGARDLATYVRHTLELAHSPYGRRWYRTFGWYDGSTLVGSFKRYERTIHHERRRLKAMGIGAVFTVPEYRGRGYGRTMLATALDRAGEDGYDLAYLFSDIHPAFYAAIGLRELPSRSFSFRSDALPPQRIEVAQIATRDWPAIERMFARRERLRPWGFERSASVWGWIRLRNEHESQHPHGTATCLALRTGEEIGAYVLGVRMARRDAYVVDEFGFDAEHAGLVGPLLRAAAGDLRRVVGWLPPDGARRLLPRASVHRRKSAILMATALTPQGQRLIESATAPSDCDGVWATDHV
ncbi:MAG: GNAT family N-acetyltransferase [Vulcanimicrobiaceae bacterium]